MTSTNFTKEEFVDYLFNFIEKHFNDFNHQKKDGNDTWFNPSWSPFIQACFIEWGKRLNLKVGSSYTAGNLKNFWTKYINRYYEKPTDRGFDISWHDDDYEFILGLEHEETGKTSDGRIKNICDELEKLRVYKGKNKILISRPYFNTTQNYQIVEDIYKERIEQKLKQITPSDEENWIIILIGLKNRLIPPQDETKILFCCYFWEGNRLAKFREGRNILVKMNENNQVEKA